MFTWRQKKPINRHFVGHTEADVCVAVLQKLHGEGKQYRLLVEESWIQKLDTYVPQGCNIKSN